MKTSTFLVRGIGVSFVLSALVMHGCGGDDDGNSAAGGTGGGSSGSSGKGGKGGKGGEGGEGGEGARGGTGGGAGEAGGGTSGGAGEAGGDGASNARLSVDLSFTSLLPNEQEFLVVLATADNGSDETATVTSADETIATATIVGTTLVIQAGTELGETVLTVESASGLEKTVTVLVSDPRALKIGDDLLVAWVSDFDLLYQDGGSGASLDGSYWAPRLSNGFFALGHHGQVGYADPSGTAAMLVVKPLSEDALAIPTDLAWIWDDAGSGGDWDGSFWKPVCPTNYQALGTVAAMASWTKPPLDVVRCVRSDLVEPGALGAALWNDLGSGANNDFASWSIAVAPGSESAGTVPLVSGSFVGANVYTAPASDPTANILRLGIPIVREIELERAFPSLDSLLPPEETTPVEVGRAVLIPFIAVADPARTLDYKVSTSPFYRLERDVYYRRLVHQYNQTSVDQTISHTVTTGVTREDTEEFSITTGISISVEGGVSFIVDATATVTVSLELGYSSSTTIGEFREESVTKDVVVPPRTAAALWQLIHRFTLKRRNGNTWETVGAPWEVGVNSFVVDQYPD